MMNKVYNFIKTLLRSAAIAIVILNVWILLFSIYEYHSSWNNFEWCNEPQLLLPEENNRNRSIVMIHGFGGSPFDFKPLAKELQQQGFTVRIPILPGQNKDFFAYNRGTFDANFFEKWLYDILMEEQKRFGKKPYLVGFSMGGTLSTILAKQQQVSKLVLIAPFYSLPQNNDLIVAINQTLGFILPVVPKVANGQVYSVVGHNAYKPGTFLVSSFAFLQLNTLAVKARSIAPQLDIPIFIVASSNDKVASFTKIQELFARNSHAEIHDYPDSNHIMLYDYPHKKIILDILSFVTK